MDIKDLAARISRVEGEISDKLVLLEQRMQAGTFGSTKMEDTEESPQPVENIDTPQVPEENVSPMQEPEQPIDQDWIRIRDRVAPELDPMVRPFLSRAVRENSWR